MKKEVDEDQDVSEHAVWSVSSAKTGHGVKCLRDGDLTTYWQSDGHQPHAITVEFPMRTEVESVAIYLDHSLDESYTPEKISFQAGLTSSDLEELNLVTLEAPKGWVKKPLINREEDDKSPPKFFHAHVVRISILSNHQNGRDTHVRQVKIIGPKTHSEVEEFKTTRITMYSSLR